MRFYSLDFLHLASTEIFLDLSLHWVELIFLFDSQENYFRADLVFRDFLFSTWSDFSFHIAHLLNFLIRFSELFFHIFSRGKTSMLSVFPDLLHPLLTILRYRCSFDLFSFWGLFSLFHSFRIVQLILGFEAHNFDAQSQHFVSLSTLFLKLMFPEIIARFRWLEK